MTDRASAEGLREPTLDELWAAVAASLAVADEHKAAIYRSGDGVPGPEALAGIQKHIEAGLAARVMYDRLAALRDTSGIDGHGGIVDRVRQRTASIGFDLMAARQASSVNDAVARDAALDRLEAHVRGIDAIMTAALRNTGSRPDSGIDVDWLVETMNEWYGPDLTFIDDIETFWTPLAEHIAREYARLSTPRTETNEERWARYDTERYPGESLSTPRTETSDD